MYKAGTQATWSVINDKVPMEGLLGFFQGKYKAVMPNGAETMNQPKEVTVIWEADYTLPYILIPLVILVIIMAIIGLYFLLRRTQPKLAPATAYAPQPLYGPQPMGPRPIPQQHTTVVMIGDQGEKQKQLPSTTKQELVEKFAQLLDTYEAEIKSSMGVKDTPQIRAADGKMLSSPAQGAHAHADEVYEAEVNDVSICGQQTKKLLRTVTTNWRQMESSTIAIASSNENEDESMGLSITWARDIYHEWEITSCTLPPNHSGRHKGDVKVLYSLLNTVTVKQSYNPDESITPPSPHFTDSMPFVDIGDENNIIEATDLPSISV